VRRPQQALERKLLVERLDERARRLLSLRDCCAQRAGDDSLRGGFRIGGLATSDCQRSA
jgi:hypothetical protein